MRVQPSGKRAPRRQRIDRDDLLSIARRFARDPVFADREEV
jgi:hypothetical protein